MRGRRDKKGCKRDPGIERNDDKLDTEGNLLRHLKKSVRARRKISSAGDGTPKKGDNIETTRASAFKAVPGRRSGGKDRELAKKKRVKKEVGNTGATASGARTEIGLDERFRRQQGGACACLWPPLPTRQLSKKKSWEKEVIYDGRGVRPAARERFDRSVPQLLNGRRSKGEGKWDREEGERNAAWKKLIPLSRRFGVLEKNGEFTRKGFLSKEKSAEDGRKRKKRSSKRENGLGKV